MPVITSDGFPAELACCAGLDTGTRDSEALGAGMEMYCMYMPVAYGAVFQQLRARRAIVVGPEASPSRLGMHSSERLDLRASQSSVDLFRDHVLADELGLGGSLGLRCT